MQFRLKKTPFARRGSKRGMCFLCGVHCTFYCASFDPLFVHASGETTDDNSHGNDSLYSYPLFHEMRMKAVRDDKVHDSVPDYGHPAMWAANCFVVADHTFYRSWKRDSYNCGAMSVSGTKEKGRIRQAVTSPHRQESGATLTTYDLTARSGWT
jgi:hypothetical protein